MDLTCPKCRAAMRSYERGGVTVDQCTECRGIFLDRGELEHLIDAEAAFNRGPSSSAAPAHGTPVPQTQQPPYESYRRYDSDRPKRYDSDRPGYKRYDSDRPYGYGGKRRKSFLEQLFD